MNLPLLIARRMAHTSSEQKPGVMERIALFSVGLSVVVMLLSLAVMMGFKQEVSRKMTGLAAHVTLTDIRGIEGLDSRPMRRSDYLDSLIRHTEGFHSMAPYALKGGIIRTAEAVEGVLLKGVDATYDWSFYEEWLLEGELPRIGDTLRTKDLLLSEQLAQRLQLEVGSRIEMLFVESGQMPRRDRFKVSGIYASGMDEMDAGLLLTDLRNVQRLSDWSDDEVTGYEIFTADLHQADTYARMLDHTLLYDPTEQTNNLVVTSITERYSNIFDWLKAHDVNAAVVLVIMLVVAFFNMASVLLVLVLERTRTIGLLKALGMPNRDLRKIFLYRAGFIALKGLAWGNLIGLGLALLQQHFAILKLDAEGYLLSSVPISLNWEWILLLNIGFLATIIALLIIPTYIISSVKPDESIRYE